MPPRTWYTFADVRIPMRPVPIRYVDEFRSLFQEIQRIEKDEGTLLAERVRATYEMYLFGVLQLLHYYEVPLGVDQIENSASIDDMQTFIEKQMELQTQEAKLVHEI